LHCTCLKVRRMPLQKLESPYLTGLWQSLQKPRDIRGIDLDARCGELSTDLLRDGWQQNPFLTRNLLRHCLPARGYSHCMRKCSCPSVLQACWLSHCEGNTQEFFQARRVDGRSVPQESVLVKRSWMVQQSQSDMSHLQELVDYRYSKSLR